MSHDYSPLFLRYIQSETKRSSTGWLECRCPWPQNHKHGDKTWSFGFNPEQGTFKCHGCGIGGGPADFVGYMEIPGYSGDNHDDKKRAVTELREILRQLGIDNSAPRPTRTESTKKKVADLPSDGEIKEWEECLDDEEELKRYLTAKRHWSEKEIKDLRIGYDRGRYMIPIYRSGELVNVRRYRPSADKAKMIGLSGHNSPALFPWKALDKELVFLMEGEPDVIAARSIGINAATFTGGAGNYDEGDISHFRGKKVVVMYDADAAGRKGAAVVAAALRRYTQKIKIVDFAKVLDGAEGKDFTDACSAFGPADARRRSVAAAQEAPWYEPEVDNTQQVFEPSLKDATNAKYIGKQIRVRAIVAGLRERPFAIRTSARITCAEAGSHQKCAFCSLSTGSELEWKIKHASEDPLRQVEKSEATRKKVLMEAASINCGAFTIKSSESQTLEEAVLVPPINALSDMSSEDFSPSAVTAYVFMESDRLKINQIYNFTGTVVTNPTNSVADLVFTHAEECEEDLDRFELKDPQRHIEVLDDSREVEFLEGVA